jgi:dipeptidyl aminopeptidase/acylaminoacyl peptidase
LQWTANGTYLASTSDADVRLWHIQRRIGTPLTTLSGHTDKVLALSWSPQGSLLASSGADTTIRIWHVSSTPNSAPAGQTAWWGHEGGVFALDWSPDGTRLVSGGKDRMVRVWDQKGNPVKAWQAHGRGGVSALAWSPHDSLLASGGVDHQVHIWDSATGSPLLACKEHNDEIRHLSWSPDGKILASFAGKKDRQVCLWDPHTGHLLAALTGHNREIVGLYWAADATWLATVSADATLRVWQVSPTLRKQPERSLFIPQGTPLAIAGAPATDLIAVGLTNQLIRSSNLAERAVYPTIVPINNACTTKGYQRNLFFVAGLETHGSTGGNVQVHTIGGLAIKFQCMVYFKEMEVAANLHRSIACMAHKQLDGRTPFIGDNVAPVLV